MQEASIAVGFLVIATFIGMLFKPNADQLRPLTPQASAGHDAHHDSHHH